jgi:putative ABC transport system permease protein
MRIPNLKRWLRLPGARERIGRDVDDEIAFHLAMRERDLIEAGAGASEAQERARREFGDLDLARRTLRRAGTRHETRALWSMRLDEMRQDFSFSARQMRRNPGFAAVAVLTLALGIALNSAIFSVVDAVLLHPLPFAEPDRLVVPWQVSANTKVLVTPPPTIAREWRAQATSLAQLELFTDRDVTLRGADQAEVVPAQLIGAGFLRLVGLRPALGRGFVDEETHRGSNPVAMISYALWQTRFGGDRGVIGQSIVVDDRARTIVGVMPAALDRPIGSWGSKRLWLPLAEDSAAAEKGGLMPLARLREGATVEGAKRELETIARRQAAADPTRAEWSATLMRPAELVANGMRDEILVLFAAVGLVMLIACANVANLLLARGVVRARELAVRTALGADRVRLVRQLLVESLVLAAIAGVVGLGLGWWMLRGVVALRPQGMIALDLVRFDPTVVAFTLGLALATGVLFGLLPALRSTHIGVNQALKSGAGGATSRAGSRRVRGALVTVEVALSVLLLVGAGLAVRGMQRLQRVEAGFDATNLLSVDLLFPEGRLRKAPAQRAALDEVTQRIRRLGGVSGVSVAMGTPPDYAVMFGTLGIDGRALAEKEAPALYTANFVDTAYFTTMRIPLRQGRAFTAADEADSTTQIIINQALAQRFWPNGDAVGARMRLGTEPKWMTVVGVAGDVQSALPGSDFGKYQLHLTRFDVAESMRLIVRTTGDPLAFADQVKRAVAAADGSIAIHEVTTVGAAMSNAIAQPRFIMSLLSVFAAMALVLAVIGLYGVLSYAVTQRTRELGIRIALGATPESVVRLVVREGVTLAVLGVVLGAGSALGLTRLLSSLLYGVSPRDPATFLVAGAVLLVVAVIACLIPARRASRVDPMVALRAD